MACRALALRSLLLPDPLHHLSLRAAASAPAAPFPCRRRRRNLRCCSSSSGGGPGEQGQPPQEAVLEAISNRSWNAGDFFYVIVIFPGMMEWTKESEINFTLTTEQISRRHQCWRTLDSRRGGSGMTPSYSSASWLKGACLHNRPLYVATLHTRITEINLFPCCLLLKEVAKSKGRVALTTNMVIGGTVTDDSSDEWLVLDQKVNTYPTDRGFTAIGTGGEDFVHSMVDAVESVLQESIPKGQVSQKISSRGKYVSVKIGPIRVASSEQVQAVYRAMRRDNRMKYFL
uniref:Uncharacterized protein n=1 Tax=Aegilops tauschii TaxID=37682 RepID=M8BS60_AEGTA